MPNPITDHCKELNACNQRGGRMLSITDLIAAGTFTPETAAYALAAISQGRSFLIGARPGGAGKTTVMAALLNFLPPAVPLATAESLPAIRRILAAAPTPQTCYICHEIGPGPYYAYLWADALRAYFQLPSAGHLLATNLHADTFAEARDQICSTNAVPESQLRAIHLMFFLDVRPTSSGTTRRLATIWATNGTTPHRQIYSQDDAAIDPTFTTPAQLRQARTIVDHLIKHDLRTIEQVRTYIVQAMAT